MEQLVASKDAFNNQQTALRVAGLFIYNANIKELKDTAGSEYFKYMRMKTQEDAINKGKVRPRDVTDRERGDGRCE